MYIEILVCRLYEKEDTSHFFLPWVPLMHTVVEGFSFDWAKLLSDSLASRITEYRAQNMSGKVSSFFMCSYIMDVVCFMTPFPLMSWSWTPNNAEPIHVYHSKLWKENVKYLFYEICHYIPVHQILYGYSSPRISEKIMGNLKVVFDWFIEENFSYVRVFSCSIPPHTLPEFLPVRLVCREVAY